MCRIDTEEQHEERHERLDGSRDGYTVPQNKIFWGGAKVPDGSGYTRVISLALPDRFFPFFFVGPPQRKTGKSGLATRDYRVIGMFKS